MRKISTHVLSFIVALAALTLTGLASAVDGLILLESSDPGVLAVTPLDGGLFRVDVVGPGTATLTASGDADLGDGIQTIATAFEYQVFDAGLEADHFELSASGFVYQEPEVLDPGAGTADVMDASTARVAAETGKGSAAVII